RIAEGSKGDPKKSWREQEDPRKGHGEYEPRDSRNVEGGAATRDDRWTRNDDKPPRGVPQEHPMDAEDAARAKKTAPGQTGEADAAAAADAHWRERDAKRPRVGENATQSAATKLPPD